MVVLLLAAGAPPASADLTAFLGANTTPTNGLARGFSVGAGLLLLGFEFEYASVPEDEDALAPGLRTGMGNVLLQTPFEIFRIQPYVTAGVGLYRERLEDHQDTGFGVNTGGGAKITLTGPLRVRVDYRVFRLGGGALESPAHRIYAGLNLRF
jgi:hypothetical protein